jgi:hypothetical protein
MASAAFDEPSRCLHSKAADAADNKVRPRRIDFEFPAGRRIGSATRTGRTNKDLADVTGLLHQPHRFDDVGAVKHRVGKRRKFSGFKGPDHLAE